MIGSRYSRPGVLPLVELGNLAPRGVIGPNAAPLLRGLSDANVRHYDCGLKCGIAANGKGFSAEVFESAALFPSGGDRPQ